MASTCIVTGADYARYWGGQGAIEAPKWTGHERRSTGDRRSHKHDRRITAENGRRRGHAPFDRRTR